MTILVTGAAGFIGSHTVHELLVSGHDVVAIDNCCNAYASGPDDLPESLRRVEVLTNRQLKQYLNVDLLDVKALDEVLSKYAFDAVIHFAALKSVGESCQMPLKYYGNNVTGTINLLEGMKKSNIRRLIFSSSATVYGRPDYLPIDEKHIVGRALTNPYGKTKYFIEEILKDLVAAEEGWCVTSLRYFNPVGAHESGQIGEDPTGIPNNLMPFLSQVAIKKRPFLSVFGNDFDTPDGTGVRDYIHIMDLARGHTMALDRMLKEEWRGWHVFNLGTGKGYSVLEMVAAFEKATGATVPYKIVERRAGDIANVYADCQQAGAKLGWKAQHTLEEMCRHTWNWQLKNPNGFRPQ